MISLIWPMIMVIAANSFYNVVAKSTPKDVNAFLSLAVTYGLAALISFVVFMFTRKGGMMQEMGNVNWTAFAFSVCVIMLEVGYIFIYRAGWKVSMASLIANIALAVVLLGVGLMFYKEELSARQFIGIAVSIAGLVLMF